MQDFRRKTEKALSSQRGQALLFIIVALTISLTIGIAVSQRAISSLRRTSNTDTNARVFAAAEGGIEFYLRLAEATLTSLSDGNNFSNGTTNECPTGTTRNTTPVPNGICTLALNTTSTTEKIGSSAEITVSKFTTNGVNNGEAMYFFNLDTGDVKEVQLASIPRSGSVTYFSGDIDLCWQSNGANPSALYYIIYDATGPVVKRLVLPNSGSIPNQYGGVNAGAGKTNFTNGCHTITIASGANRYGLRIKTLVEPSTVAVFPKNGAVLPFQGFKITSLGFLGTAPTQAGIRVITKNIIVYRSFSYIPATFDYGLFMGDDSGQPLN